MRKRWRFVPHDVARVQALERSAAIPAVVAQLLVARGVTDPEIAQAFLAARLTDLHPPESLPGASAAATRLAAAVRERRPIVVYGDYDVDGMTGTALLWKCLTLLDADVSYYVPHRIDEGYGLHEDALRQLAERGASLIVSVDCGITAVGPARLARELGLELIITDHHEPADELPDAAAIVHPGLGSNYPFRDLCGAGVALKLAWALCQEMCGQAKVTPRMRAFLLEAVGLAGIGTVADVVPLLGENRILVRHALLSLREQPSLGLRHLMQRAKLADKPRLTSEDIAFALAPRLNAAGRLGQATLGVELLTTSSESRAAQLAEYVDELNVERQSVERSIVLSATKRIQEEFPPADHPAFVLASADWHPGVIGVVAGRLAERWHRPVVMIALDAMGARPGVGSGRSVPGFDLHAALHHCREHLLGFGGHAAAAGVKIDPQAIPAFRAEFSRYVADNVHAEQQTPELHLEAEAPLASFSLRVVEQIEQLAPFGAGNRRPMVCTTGVRLAGPPKRIGGGRHLSLSVTQHGVTLRGVAFGNGDWADELPVDTPLQIAFQPIINEYQGRRSVELHLADWRLHEPQFTAVSAAALA